MSRAENFKNGYQDIWEVGNRREQLVQSIFEELDVDTKFKGLGANETRYIEGSGVENGHKTADPDISILGTDIEVEVTGTNKQSVNPQDDVWIMDTKLEESRDNPDVEKWVAHVLGGCCLVRCVKLTPDIVEEQLKDENIIKVYLGNADDEPEYPSEFHWREEFISLPRLAHQVIPDDVTLEECQDAFDRVKARWITTENIDEGEMNYLVLQPVSHGIDAWKKLDDGEVVEKWFTDRTGERIRLRIPVDSECRGQDWDPDTWYTILFLVIWNGLHGFHTEQTSQTLMHLQSSPAQSTFTVWVSRQSRSMRGGTVFRRTS